MDPKTLQLILFAEQMAALAASTVAQVRAQITGSSTKAVDEVLADADSTYQQIIANAQKPGQ